MSGNGELPKKGKGKKKETVAVEEEAGAAAPAPVPVPLPKKAAAAAKKPTVAVAAAAAAAAAPAPSSPGFVPPPLPRQVTNRLDGGGGSAAAPAVAPAAAPTPTPRPVIAISNRAAQAQAAQAQAAQAQAAQAQAAQAQAAVPQGPFVPLIFPSGLVNPKGPKYVNRPIGQIIGNIRPRPAETNFKLSNSPIVVPSRPTPFLRPPSPTNLSRQITEYLGVGDAVANTKLIKELMEEFLLMNLGSTFRYNGDVLDFTIFNRPGVAVMEESNQVSGSMQTDHFPSTKGTKHLTGVVLVKDSGSVAYVKCGTRWYTANPKVGVLQTHVLGMPEWSSVKESKFAVCFYTSLPSAPRNLFGEGTIIFSGRNRTNSADTASTADSAASSPLVGGGGAASAASAAAAAAAAVVQAELATPLEETTNIDSLFNVLCFATGFHESFVTEALFHEACTLKSRNTGLFSPILFQLFERLLGRGDTDSVYSRYLQSVTGEYNAKLQALQAAMAEGQATGQAIQGQINALSQRVNQLRPFVDMYRERVRSGYRATSEGEIYQEQQANQQIVDILTQQEQLGNLLTQCGERLATLQHEYNRHLASNGTIATKLESIRNLQAGFEERIANSIYKRGVLRAAENNISGPMGGLSLQTETIKECRALKTLSSMLLRLCEISSMPRANIPRVAASKVRYSRRRQTRRKYGKFASANKHGITRRQAAVAAQRRKAARNKTLRARRRAVVAANAAAKKMNEYTNK
jgi:hypothetical protein